MSKGRYREKVKFSVTGTYGCGPEGEDDVYTVNEFVGLCDSKAFIDYDGHGHPVKDGFADPDTWIDPSTAKQDIPGDATHVVWYNR